MPQAFVPGDSRINRAGRPRRLSTELQRLRDAAVHVDRLLESHVMCDLLIGRKTPTPAPRELLRAGEILRDEIREIDAAVEVVAGLLGPEWPENIGWRRRRKAVLGAADFEQRCLQAGAALDRLLPDEGPRQ